MKKFLKILLLIIIIIPILYTLIFFIQNYSIKKSFESEYISSDQSYIIETKLLKCNLNIFQPEFVRVTEFEDRAEKRLSFYKPIHLFSQSNEEWRNSRIGGTTVKNTTFPELVEMVKEDCSQFQKGHGDYYGEDLAWSYSPYTPEPEKTPEEIAEEEYERWLIDAIDEMRRGE